VFELRQDGRVTQRGHVARLAVFGDVAQEPAHDLPGSRLGQVVGPDDPAGPGQLADLPADMLAQPGLEIRPDWWNMSGPCRPASRRRRSAAAGVRSTRRGPSAVI
jgi:hypothetical protein